MPMLHDPVTRQAIAARVRSVRADSPRAWGKMSPDQMLWHLNTTLREALGDQPQPVMKVPIPRAVIRFMVISMPWGKGARTAPGFVARESYDVAAECASCLELIERFAGRPLGAPWPPHCAFGRMTGPHWSKLMAKHFDHHLRQFGC